jgi:hypothetical protein
MIWIIKERWKLHNPDGHQKSQSKNGDGNESTTVPRGASKR